MSHNGVDFANPGLCCFWCGDSKVLVEFGAFKHLQGVAEHTAAQGGSGSSILGEEEENEGLVIGIEECSTRTPIRSQRDLDALMAQLTLTSAKSSMLEFDIILLPRVETAAAAAVIHQQQQQQQREAEEASIIIREQRQRNQEEEEADAEQRSRRSEATDMSGPLRKALKAASPQRRQPEMCVAATAPQQQHEADEDEEADDEEALPVQRKARKTAAPGGRHRRSEQEDEEQEEQQQKQPPQTQTQRQEEEEETRPPYNIPAAVVERSSYTDVRLYVLGLREAEAEDPENLRVYLGEEVIEDDAAYRAFKRGWGKAPLPPLTFAFVKPSQSVSAPAAAAEVAAVEDGKKEDDHSPIKRSSTMPTSSYSSSASRAPASSTATAATAAAITTCGGAEEEEMERLPFRFPPSLLSCLTLTELRIYALLTPEADGEDAENLKLYFGDIFLVETDGEYRELRREHRLTRGPKAVPPVHFGFVPSVKHLRQQQQQQQQQQQHVSPIAQSRLLRSPPASRGSGSRQQQQQRAVVADLSVVDRVSGETRVIALNSFFPPSFFLFRKQVVGLFKRLRFAERVVMLFHANGNVSATEARALVVDSDDAVADMFQCLSNPTLCKGGILSVE